MTSCKKLPPSLSDELRRLFTTHPRAAGESYCQHLTYCLGIAGRCTAIAAGALTHGLFPFLLQDYASVHSDRLATRLATRLAARRCHVQTRSQARKATFASPSTPATATPQATAPATPQADADAAFVSFATVTVDTQRATASPIA